VAGLPMFPPLELQLALNAATLRWAAAARTQPVLVDGVRPGAAVPPASAVPGPLRPVPAQAPAPPPSHPIHVLGTNHLLPWFASRVAEHLGGARTPAPVQAPVLHPGTAAGASVGGGSC
jgi:hypothetical protein